MSDKYPGINDVLGTLSSAIFNRGILYNESSTFNIITKYGVRRVLDPDCSSWNTPAHIYNLYFDLGITMKPSCCYDTSCGSNSWKYANFGTLDAGGTMMNQYPFMFTGTRLLISFHGVLLCDVVLHSNSWSIQNQVDAPTGCSHTDPSSASKI